MTWKYSRILGSNVSPLVLEYELEWLDVKKNKATI